MSWQRGYNRGVGGTGEYISTEEQLILGYLDPGTGSLIMQAVLGGAAGLAVLFRAGKQRFFRKGTAQDESVDPSDAPPEEQAAQS